MKDWLSELDHKKIWWYAFCLLFLLCLTFVFVLQHQAANQPQVGAASDGPRLAISQAYQKPASKTPTSERDFLSVTNRLQKRTDLGQPIIYLTFDDGPSKHTPELLEVLERHKVYGTFFMLGLYVEKNPEYVQAVVDNGHEIGNHTFSHSSMPPMSSTKMRREIMRTDSLIKDAAPQVNGDGSLDLLRPPYGSTNKRVAKNGQKLGYRLVFWNVDPVDWKAGSPRKITRSVLKHAKAGSVVLAHDGGGDQSRTVKAFDQIIPALQKRGFVFWRITEGL